MKDFSKLKDDVAWLIGQVKCLFSMFPSSTTWTDKHSGTTGNKYLKDQIVWYNGFIYKCLVDNNGNPTNNTFYWQKMGRGWLIQQEQADWDATGGPAFIRNKPTSLGGGTESDPIFQAWLDTNPLSGYLTSESDPVFAAWQLANDNHGDWDTAYSWGDHSNLYLLLDGTATMLPDAAVKFANNTKIGEGVADAGTGGNKGIALTCAVGYEWKWEAGEAYLTNLATGSIRIKQYAMSIPLVTDDSTKGFIVGSKWYLEDSLSYHICIDATVGAAVWEQRYSPLGLEQVLINNNTASLPIIIQNGDHLVVISNGTVSTYDSGNLSGIALVHDKILFSLNTFEVRLLYNNLVGSYDLQLPTKTGGGLFTLATMQDLPSVGNWGELNYPTWASGTPFLKMTAAGVFALDMNSYLTSISSGDVIGALGYTPVTDARTITINGTAFDLTANRSWTIPAKKAVVSDATSVSISGTTSLTLVKTYEITVGTLSAAGFLDLFMYSTRTGLSSVHTMGLYINTTNNFATATLVTSISTNGGFNPILPLRATYILKNNLLLGGILNSAAGTNYPNSVTGISVACNNTSASVWFFVGVTPSHVAQTIDFQAIEILN